MGSILTNLKHAHIACRVILGVLVSSALYLVTDLDIAAYDLVYTIDKVRDLLSLTMKVA